MKQTPAVHNKCWGTTSRIFDSTLVFADVLHVEAGWQCSRHTHEERANRFHVVSGEIIVRTWDDAGADTEHRLREGDCLTVPSGVMHRFEVIRSGVVVEIYWPDRGGALRASDIQRVDEGGRILRNE